jgi:hypothetical protein
MGADIHLFAEKKLRNNEWATVQTFSPINKKALGLESTGGYLGWLFFIVEGRNYQLFAKLAGVRGNGPQAKGVPDDASPLYREYVDSWRNDGHSHSWCTAAEFITRFIDTLDKDDPIVKAYAGWVLEVGHGNAVLTFLDNYCGIRINEGRDKADDYRFVFFFDN